MITKRLALALERLQSSDWHRFEKLASAFLASEFDDLRTVANPSGDEGRDAELFSPSAEPNVVIQYSVAADWEFKITRTVKRTQTTIPDATILIFLSSKIIGAKADSLKKRLRQESGLSLDVRDSSWFEDRVLGSLARERAAEELSEIIVDPYLASVGVAPHVPSELSSPEAIAAITFLGLRWQDDIRAKGLTKLAFEALVQAVLVNTDSDHRMSRDAVQMKVASLLPGHPEAQVHAYVDAALQRLTKRSIRHWQKDDEFCLTYDQVQRLVDFKTRAALAEDSLLSSVRQFCASALTSVAHRSGLDSALARSVRAATDQIVFQRSQAFALAVKTGSLAALAASDFSDVLISELSRARLPRITGVNWLDLLQAGVREILLSDDPGVIAHMRFLADAYTILAFLRQTPDVQRAIEKMFSHGQIWLDTTIILPMIAESALSDGPPGRFTRMIKAAREAGLELFVTPGMVEEVERHMNLALTYARWSQGQWLGDVPYLFERYVASGRSKRAFPQWLENFRGAARPDQDISDYLREEFSITTRSLEAERDSAPAELRHALQRFWYDAHRRRREQHGRPVDEMVLTRLVEHDVECYCGIVQLRRRERSSPFGYGAWWLTVDRHAFDLKPTLRASMQQEPPDSPVLSADFMVNYLAFGPVRRRVDKATEAQLPLIMDLRAARQLTPALLVEADTLREELKDLPERIVMRRVRDHLNRARSTLGPVAHASLEDLADEIQ
jgi:hypothetical protein